METFSALLAICAENSPVPGEFPAQRPVTRSFDIFFDLRLNKRLSKQWWGWWFETLSHPLWRHRNVWNLVSRGCMRTSVIINSIIPISIIWLKCEFYQEYFEVKHSKFEVNYAIHLFFCFVLFLFSVYIKGIWYENVYANESELEQLERLRSEDTPRRLMITHTIESCWIPSQN